MTVSRRFFLQGAGLAALSSVTLGATKHASPAQPSPEEALLWLFQGNERYRTGKATFNDLPARRTQVASAQHPFAMILTCADSRVPPELIFDRTLGDLFVVRLAGNYPTTGGIGSFEYAYEHFDTPLLLVLGHSGCGAVQATVDALKNPGSRAPDDIEEIVKAITPSAKKVLNKPGSVYENAVRQNAIDAAAKLKATPPILQKAVANSKLRVASAVYDLKSGDVTLLSHS
jgi:carbonic anhydrase